ncbi:MAG: phenylalanine--tRNA ligase subunit alpha [Candidatus Saccharimonadales bacterium]
MGYNDANMAYQNPKINEVADLLRVRLQILDNKADILKATELRALYGEIKSLPAEQRADYGKEINDLKKELEDLVEANRLENEVLPAIDVTAPWDVNTPAESRPRLLPSEHGSQHPLTVEIAHIVDIFSRMGFTAYPSREIDDEYHMFTSLNFPAGHPARDDYDTFMTEQVDKTGEPFIAPAHTSTMQHRIIKAGKKELEAGTPIAAIIADRVFRNEDLDATHEHTFYQLEGIYVGKGVHAGMLIATLETYLSEYFGEKLKTKLQPFYFPFTEPSFEFAVERPAILRKNNSEEQKWLELGGCGMIHPNVLKQAGVDPTVYTGFAWGFGIERMVMMKNGIEDVRHFESGKLDFLGQFA